MGFVVLFSFGIAISWLLMLFWVWWVWFAGTLFVEFGYECVLCFTFCDLVSAGFLVGGCEFCGGLFAEVGGYIAVWLWLVGAVWVLGICVGFLAIVLRGS